jgi:serine/threonine protein phosphatase PrpC
MFSYATLQGVRESNEDNHNIILNFKENINMYAIYDGHGGPHVSNVLCKVLPKKFQSLQKMPSTNSEIEAIYNEIEKELETKIPANVIKECGSASLVVFERNVAAAKSYVLINLGDCRAIVCRKDKPVTLTIDHRPMWPQEKKRIDTLGGKITMDQGDWRICGYSLSRAFGDCGAKPFISHCPDMKSFKPHPNDKFMIVACDGVWDYVNEQDIVNFVLSVCYDKNGKLNPTTVKTVARKLGNFCLKRGSQDNITIIIIFI